MKSAKPAVDPVDDPDIVKDPKERSARYSVARKEAWLKENAAGFALFQKALRTPTRHPAIRAGSGGMDPFPSYAQLRQLARNKVVEAHAREMRRDWNGAVQSHIDIVQMGTDIGQGGPLIASLVGIAIQAIGRNDVWFASEKLNLAQTRAAVARLEAIYNRRLRFDSTLVVEKQYGLDQIRYIVRQPDWRNPDVWGEITPAQRVMLLTVTPAQLMDQYTASLDQQIQMARRPYSQQRPVQRESRDTLDEIFAPTFSRAAGNYARGDAGNALWTTGLALQAYKLQHGRYPQDLQTLVPGLLHRVPLDPYSGVAPLQYKRVGSSYLLWSIGPDMVNNGGKAVAWRSTYTPVPGERPALPTVLLDSKGDFVARQNR